MESQQFGIAKRIQEKDKGLIFSVAYTPDGRQIVTGNEYGAIRVYNLKQSSHLSCEKKIKVSPTNESILAIALKPHVSMTTYGKSYADSDHIAIVSCGYAGKLKRIELKSGKTIKEWVEKGNEIYAVKYRQDGKLFATAGKDRVIRLYDEISKKLVQEMALGEKETSGKKAHVNRIYAIEFHPSKPNIIYTAGWDQTIQVFDRQVGRAIQHISNINIAGKSLVVATDGICAGSSRPHSQIQEYDQNDGTLKYEYEIPDEVKDDGKPHLFVSTLALDPTETYLYASGTHVHRQIIYKRPIMTQNSKDKWILKQKATIDGYEKTNEAIYAAAWQPKPKMRGISLITGGANGQLYLWNDQPTTWTTMHESILETPRTEIEPTMTTSDFI